MPSYPSLAIAVGSWSRRGSPEGRHRGPWSNQVERSELCAGPAIPTSCLMYRTEWITYDKKDPQGAPSCHFSLQRLSADHHSSLWKTLSSSTRLWWKYSLFVRMDSKIGVWKRCSPSGPRIRCTAQCIRHPFITPLSLSNWTSHTRMMAQSDCGTFSCSPLWNKATEET